MRVFKDNLALVWCILPWRMRRSRLWRRQLISQRPAINRRNIDRTNQSRKTGFPEFFADTKSGDNLRRQFIEAPMDAAGQAALGTGIELATLMSFLPDAFAASQRHEAREGTEIWRRERPASPSLADVETGSRRCPEDNGPTRPGADPACARHSRRRRRRFPRFRFELRFRTAQRLDRALDRYQDR